MGFKKRPCPTVLINHKYTSLSVFKAIFYILNDGPSVSSAPRTAAHSPLYGFLYEYSMDNTSTYNYTRVEKHNNQWIIKWNAKWSGYSVLWDNTPALHWKDWGNKKKKVTNPRHWAKIWTRFFYKTNDCYQPEGDHQLSDSSSASLHNSIQNKNLINTYRKADSQTATACQS